jgi:hypothetical protein
LRRVPNAENRSEVEARISEAQRLADEQKQASPPPSQNPNPPAAIRDGLRPQESPTGSTTVHNPGPDVNTAKRGRLRLVVGSVTVGVGAVCLAAGGALYGVAVTTNDAISNPASGAVFDPGQERTMKTDQAAGIVLLSIGSAAVVAGVAVAIVGAREMRTRAHVSVLPAIAPDRVGAVFDARF